MRILIAVTTACVLLAGTVQAKDMKACSADWKAQKAAKTSGSQTHKQFMTTCLAAGSPGVAPTPPAASAPMQQPGKGAPNAGVAPTMAAANAPTGGHRQVQGRHLQHVQAPQRVLLPPRWRRSVPPIALLSRCSLWRPSTSAKPSASP